MCHSDGGIRELEGCTANRLWLKMWNDYYACGHMESRTTVLLRSVGKIRDGGLSVKGVWFSTQLTERQKMHTPKYLLPEEKTKLTKAMMMNLDQIWISPDNVDALVNKVLNICNITNWSVEIVSCTTNVLKNYGCNVVNVHAVPLLAMAIMMDAFSVEDLVGLINYIAK